MIITQQMVRDALYYKGRMTAHQLAAAMFLPPQMVFVVHKHLAEMKALGDVVSGLDERHVKFWEVSQTVKYILDLSNRKVAE